MKMYCIVNVNYRIVLLKRKLQFSVKPGASQINVRALKMTLSLSADDPNINLPCQIYVVKEDKEPVQSLPVTAISRPIRGGASNL